MSVVVSLCAAGTYAPRSMAIHITLKYSLSGSKANCSTVGITRHYPSFRDRVPTQSPTVFEPNIRPSNVELFSNQDPFAANTEHFHKEAAMLLTNLAVFRYLHDHPNAPADKLPGVIQWTSANATMQHSVWDSATSAASPPSCRRKRSCEKMSSTASSTA